jgi:hypothetical protein
MCFSWVNPALMDVTFPAAVFNSSQESAQPRHRKAVSRKIALIKKSGSFIIFMVCIFKIVIKFAGCPVEPVKNGILSDINI